MSYRIIAFGSDGVGAFASALMLHRLDPKGNLVKSADLFSGSAFGAITALALANGIRIDEILGSFRTKMAGFFESESGGDCLYSSAGLQAEIGRLFGVARLAEMPRSAAQVMIAAERQAAGTKSQWDTITLGSGRSDNFTSMLLSDAAMSACSAAVYFRPHELEPVDDPKRGRFRAASLTAEEVGVAAIEYAAEHFGVESRDCSVLAIGTAVKPQDASASTASLAKEGLRGRMQRSWRRMWPFSRFGGGVQAAPHMMPLPGIQKAAQLARSFTSVKVPLECGYAFDECGSIAALEHAVEQYLLSPESSAAGAALDKYWDTSTDMELRTQSQRSMAFRA